MSDARIELDLSAPPEAVAERLRSITEPARLLRTPSRGDGAGARPLVGRVGAHAFTVRLNTSYRNPFGAQCHGELLPLAATHGTRVRARIRPSALAELAVALWCVTLGSIALGRVWAAGTHAPARVLALVAPAGLMALGGVVLALLGLQLARGETPRLEALLRAALASELHPARGAAGAPGAATRRERRRRRGSAQRKRS
ncbi:MAG TPA: hypothetical protein VFS44_08645 [Gemmatimonadaceae bacterium]|nr:hypothetical protein [Gemmatimonadaceae bacterium]